MSGGIAYLYDENKNSKQRINQQMVDLDKITDDKTLENELKGMIEDYIKYTNSQEAKDILKNWDNKKDNFIVVFPSDYKRVLKEQNEEKKEV
jgi:glutamate synthase domain-containing protein 3